MKLKQFLRLFYIFQFFFDFIFIYAVEKLFMLSRGISMAEIGFLLFLWSLMTMVLEVPTGILADHWSRRKMMILSGISYAITYFIWTISGSFWGFLIGYLFRTIASTFTSGSLQAYVYDYLLINKNEGEFEKIWGRGNALRTLGIGIAVLIGGFLSEISFTLTCLLSAISIFTISIVAFIWPEIPPQSSTGEVNYWKFLKGSISTVTHNPNILRIVVFSAVVMSIFASLEEYNDVYLNFLGFPKYAIGIIFTLATVGQSVGSLIAHKFKNNSWSTLNVITILGFLILLATYLFKSPFIAILILLLGIFLEFARVLNEGIIQKETLPNQRATVASLNTFVHNILPFQLLFGFVAQHYRLQLSYLTLAILILLYFCFVIFQNLHLIQTRK